MKCQRCNKNEVSKSYIIRFNGDIQELHLCEDCARTTEAWYASMQKAGSNDLTVGNTLFMEREIGTQFYPFSSGEEIKKRRIIHSLHARLEEAIKCERYEQADKIYKELEITKKDTVYHDEHE
ncbi:MAG: hypothetical protein ACK5LC_06045 [Coprobacillaceae bacterium]